MQFSSVNVYVHVCKRYLAQFKKKKKTGSLKPNLGTGNSNRKLPLPKCGSSLPLDFDYSSYRNKMNGENFNKVDENGQNFESTVSIVLCRIFSGTHSHSHTYI